MIHPTALIHESVKIGSNVSIGAYSVIEADTIIEDNVTIQGSVRIGKYCTIRSGCIIKWGCILTQHVELCNNVFFGTGATVLGSDSDLKEQHGTVIGEGCYIGAKALIFPKASIVGLTVIGAGAIIRNPIQAQGTYVGLNRRVE